MNYHRSLAPVSATLAAAALTGLTTLVARRARNRRSQPTFRHQTGGCVPDVGMFTEGYVTVTDIDGTHQGAALAILRERFTPATPQQPDSPTDAAVLTALAPLDGSLDTTVEPDDLDYLDTLRSCVETTINVALNLAEAEIESSCTCGSEECEAAAPDLEILHLLAGRTMLKIGLEMEAAGARHANDCSLCAHAGRQAPAYLRAQFARDIADDLLLNFDSDSTNLHGAPIASAIDVLSMMLTMAENVYDMPVLEQIDHLTLGLAQSIAHAEQPIAPQP